MRFLPVAALFLASSAQAWNIHQNMVNEILEVPSFLSEDLRAIRIPIPCQEDEQKQIAALSLKIQIRAEMVPIISKKKCGAGKAESLSLLDLLRLGFIDEPDHGMDQDLPERADPAGDRKWMGGISGPTSQGFRHMVFPGIEWGSPLATLQVPFRKIGAAPDRIEVLGKVSSEFIQSGDLFFGVRTLMWREHFIQDLLQPFHSSQVPDLALLPWKDLFSGFIEQSTRTIANYHYAYEGLADEMVRSPEERGIQECLQGGDKKVFSDWSSHISLPRTKAAGIGGALIAIFGDYLKSKSVDLPRGQGGIDYYELLNARAEALEEDDEKSLSSSEKKDFKRNGEILSGLKSLRSHTCELMREAANLFRGDLEQALQGVSSQSKTGK